MDDTAPPADAHATLSGLQLYPIKSCGGMLLSEALLTDTGLDLDRAWMLVDAHGEMLTQRELPRLALVTTQFKGDELLLRAPGMLALHLAVDVAEAATRVRVWDDEVPAFDMGALAAQWFSDFLRADFGQPVRLVHFDPEHRRLSSPRWTGALPAYNQFSDGYPLLVTSEASLADLNQRLAVRGAAEVTMQRFRPNLVLAGLQPWDEDHIDTLHIDSAEGPVTIKLVKPCVRCSIPNVDQLTAATSDEPGATLAGFRADPRMDGGLTFGVNAVIVEGADRLLRSGQAVAVRYRF